MSRGTSRTSAQLRSRMPARLRLSDNVIAMHRPGISRREFLQRAALLSAAIAIPDCSLLAGPLRLGELLLSLQQFGYGEVDLNSVLHERQLQDTHNILMDLSEDSLLKPFRQMAGLPAPGVDLGGWYVYKADYDYRKRPLASFFLDILHYHILGYCPAATISCTLPATG